MTAILRLKPDLLRRVISVFDVYQRSNSVKSEKNRHSNKNQSSSVPSPSSATHVDVAFSGDQSLQHYPESDLINFTTLFKDFLRISYNKLILFNSSRTGR